MKKLSIADVDLAGKQVFIRVDFNVPMDNGKVSDDTRIRAAIPTIKHAIDKGAKVILGSHMGRPEGEANPKYSMGQIVELVAEALGQRVAFVDSCVGEKVINAVAKLKNGDVLLLENLRFHTEETQNDPEFAKSLASLADVYVNDAFGTAHRAHASTEGITKFLDPSVSGFLLKSEIDYFTKSILSPATPLAVVLGGAKVSSKLGVVESLLDKCDILLVGGAMAFTFLKAQGYNIGPNLVEDNMLSTISDVMKTAKEKGVKLYLPVDFTVGDKLEDDVEVDVVTLQDLPDDKIAGDIGPASAILFGEALMPAKTIVWNGPMGVFEKGPYCDGTFDLAETIAYSGALTVVGGGDSVTAIKQAGYADEVDFISTGGGAFLELLEGKTLPGVAALTDAN